METLLVVDDDETSCQLFAEVLEAEGYHVNQCHSGEEALARVHTEAQDLLLVDVRMPVMNGLELTRKVHHEHPSLPIIVMTAFGSMENAFEAIQEGAFDYISKPMNLDELKKTTARALANRAWHLQSVQDGTPIEAATELNPVIGKSPAMIKVYKLVARVAPTTSTVLIQGESGTGKEVIARSVHLHSPRAGRPFVAVDCGALTETLLESELFGHVRGAFTGAVSDKKGVFEEASGGTCFLDEIGSISPHMQANLLRVLQEHEVRRVGGKEWTKVDVRVIAATNKNLEELVSNGTFREDLYYRLKVITICLPPVRERRQDIPALAQCFLRRYARTARKTFSGISDEVMERLCSYSWPGNIRELENAIEQAVVLSNQPLLTPNDLPLEVRENLRSPLLRRSDRGDDSPFADRPTLDELKKRYVLHAINCSQHNFSQAAKVLNVDRRSLYRMLAKWKIKPFFKGE